MLGGETLTIPFCDFGLVPIDEQMAWESAVANDAMAIMVARAASTIEASTIEQWKLDNHRWPLVMATRELVRKGERNASNICGLLTGSSIINLANEVQT